MTIRFTFCNTPQHLERRAVTVTREVYNYDKREYEEVQGIEHQRYPVESDRAFWETTMDVFTGEAGREAKADMNDYHKTGCRTVDEIAELDAAVEAGSIKGYGKYKAGSPNAYRNEDWEIKTLCRIYLKGVHIGCVIKHTISWYGVGDRWVGYRLDADGVYREWISGAQDRESVVGAMARREATPYDEDTEQIIGFDGEPKTNYHGNPVHHDLTLAEVWQAAQGGLLRASEARRRRELESAAICNGVVITGLLN